jgi:hypothetical protein
MRRFFGFYNFPFSAFAHGLSAALFSLMGMGFFVVINGTPSFQFWPLCLFYLVAGALVEMTTNRLAYIRLFQVIAATGWFAIPGVIFWTIISSEQADSFRAFAGLTTTMMIIGLIIVGYRANRNRSYLADIPQGPFGLLDKATGLVNPYGSPPPLRESQKRAATVVARVRRLTPLAVGLSTLLVRGLPDSGIIILVMAIAFLMTTGGSLGSGAFCFFLVTTLRWEHTHGKQIRVKR